MPPGRRDRSLRSTASSARTVMRVTFATCRSEMPRDSRARRRRSPKSVTGLSGIVVCGCAAHSQPRFAEVSNAERRRCTVPASVGSPPTSPGRKRPMAATPAAPAALIAGADRVETPPIASTGSGRAAATAATSPSIPVVVCPGGLRRGCEHGAEDDVVQAAPRSSRRQPRPRRAPIDRR